MRLSVKIAVVCLGVLIMACTQADLMAKDKFSYDGQIRLRSEYDLKSTAPERHSETFHDLRTRVGLKFEPTRRALVYVQLQDSRRLGDPSSGDLSSTENVDLHQAYFQIDDAIFENLRIKAGRFEINYGNQRIFGSVGWHNTGRSWEGGLASYRADKVRLDFFSLKRMELNDDFYNRDFDVYGLYAMLNSLNIDLFWFYELNSDSGNCAQEKLKRHNLGFYLERSHEDFDFTLQGNYQFGEKPKDTLPDMTALDITAYMLAGEVGYSFQGKTPGRIAIGVDYASGTELDEDSEYNTYVNAYYTGHKFHGYMDYFTGLQPRGLIDIVFKGQIEPAKRWTAAADFHLFKSAVDYVSKSDDSTLATNIGSEIDLTIANKSISGATITGGISMFFADAHFTAAGDDKETGVWAYLMTTVNF